MTFLEALKTRRPMRRVHTTVSDPWVFLGMEGGICGTPRWRNIETGIAVGLYAWDYEASDWEVMP